MASVLAAPAKWATAYRDIRHTYGQCPMCGASSSARSVVIVSPWLIHRNPIFWPDPERFDPERFSPARSEGRARYSFLPFGAGPRICIGAGFAITEAVLVLATILQRWRVRLVPDHPVEPVALITLRPRYGLKATAVPRGPLLARAAE